ncbi:PTS sugar transporter subunit IIA [Desulfothermus okinawensis JCM 13304]
MIGVLIVTHLDLGEKLIEVAELIMGKQELCKALTIDTSKPMEEILGDIQISAKELDRGDGVIILTDMFGGTPSNLSFSLLNSNNLDVITGVNLPMLLKIFSSRNLPLKELAEEAKLAGKKGIRVAGEVLKRKVSTNGRQ